MYVTLAEFKDYIGVSWNESDSTLTSILKSAEELLNKLCGVTTFDQTEDEELVDLRKVYTNYNGLNMYLTNKPVQSILQVNGENYNGVYGVDYIIVQDRKVMFKNLTVNDNFGFMKIKYKWGYDRQAQVWDATVDQLPEDIKQMVKMLASGMWLKKDYQGVSQYRLWDESISFGTVWEQTAEQQYYDFVKILNKYKNFNLPA